MPRTGEPFPAAPGRLFRRRRKNASSRRNCPPFFRRIIYKFRRLCLSLDRCRSFSESPPVSPTSNPEPPPSPETAADSPRQPSRFFGGQESSRSQKPGRERSAGRRVRSPGENWGRQRSFFNYPALFYCKNVAHDIKYVYVFSRPCIGIAVADPATASMRRRGSAIQRGGVARPSPAHAARSSLRAPQKKP